VGVGPGVLGNIGVLRFADLTRNDGTGRSGGSGHIRGAGARHLESIQGMGICGSCDAPPCFGVADIRANASVPSRHGLSQEVRHGTALECAVIVDWYRHVGHRRRNGLCLPAVSMTALQHIPTCKRNSPKLNTIPRDESWN
jgi:hypothetical protein